MWKEHFADFACGKIQCDPSVDLRWTDGPTALGTHTVIPFPYSACYRLIPRSGGLGGRWRPPLRGKSMRPRDTIHRRCASSPADDLANAMGEPMRPGFARVAARVAALQLFCRRSACCQTAVARPFRRFVARPRARSPRPVAPPPSLCAQRRALTGGAASGARRLGARRVRGSGGVTSALSSVAAGAPRAPCQRPRPETRRRGRAERQNGVRAKVAGAFAARCAPAHAGRAAGGGGG